MAANAPFPHHYVVSLADGLLGADPVLRSRQAHEATHLRELANHSAHIVLEPWSVGFSASVARPPALAAATLAQREV
jgi:hypothetical protein